MLSRRMSLTNNAPPFIMISTPQCPARAGMIGNRVEIPGDPVTVSGEQAANAIAQGVRRRGTAMIREPGNLLWRG